MLIFLFHLFLYLSSLTLVRAEDQSRYPTGTSRPGGSSDICGEIHSTLRLPQPGHKGKSVSFGTIDACVCIGALPGFVSRDRTCSAASNLLGRSSVLDALNDLLRNGRNTQVCHYPANAVPKCTFGDVCGFECTNGYILAPTKQCSCPKPLTVCNGQCGPYRACPSPRPHYRRELLARKPNLYCPLGQTPCGLPNTSQKGKWECVDTKSDLVSCGGCAVASPFALLASSSSEGEDCSSIPGVSDVSCISGRCVIAKCEKGYEITPNGERCFPTNMEDFGFKLVDSAAEEAFAA